VAEAAASPPAPTEPPPRTVEPEAAPTAVAAPATEPAPAPSLRAQAPAGAAPPAPKAPPRQAAKPAARPPLRTASLAPPAHSAAGEAGAAASKADLDAYRASVLARIAGAARYPETARERGVEGVAVVSFAFDAAGRVTSASLARSSGDAALDADAVASVERASPLPTPPPGAPRAYAAPIRYRLR
jgi:protein TonB